MYKIKLQNGCTIGAFTLIEAVAKLRRYLVVVAVVDSVGRVVLAR